MAAVQSQVGLDEDMNEPLNASMENDDEEPSAPLEMSLAVIYIRFSLSLVTLSVYRFIHWTRLTI